MGYWRRASGWRLEFRYGGRVKEWGAVHCVYATCEMRYEPRSALYNIKPHTASIAQTRDGHSQCARPADLHPMTSLPPAAPPIPPGSVGKIVGPPDSGLGSPAGRPPRPREGYILYTLTHIYRRGRCNVNV